MRLGIYVTLWVLGSGLAVWAQSQSQTNSLQATNLPPAPRRPNIILILADDLGYGDLGCYGQTRIKTPNIYQLAAGGLRFTQFYAGSTVCAPSRCSLMTGLHTGHAFIRGNAKQALRDEDVTLAEILKEGGYHSGLIGKWGLGNENTSGLPQRQGFAEFLGYLDQTHAHDYYTDRLWRYDFRAPYEGPMRFPENNMVASTRIMFAMSYDRMLPGFVARVSRRWGAPIIAILICYVGCVVMGYLYFFTGFAALTLDMPLMTSIAFCGSTLAGTLFPYLKSTKQIYADSPISKYKIFGLPWITVAGGLGLVYFAIMFYLYITDSRYGTNSPLSAMYIFGAIIISAVIYFDYRFFRSRQGINTDLTYKEIPTE